jgi:hypothetical protein
MINTKSKLFKQTISIGHNFINLFLKCLFSKEAYLGSGSFTAEKIFTTM